MEGEREREKREREKREITDSKINISLLFLLDPVMIVTHPTGRVHPAGYSLIELSCTATGLPVPSISWYKDGVLLLSDGDHVQMRENTFEQPNFGINTGRLHIVDLVLR